MSSDTTPHPIINLVPVQLTAGPSAKRMAVALREYADQLTEMARQLEARRPGEKFRVQLVHRYPHDCTETTQRVDCHGGVIHIMCDCNGGGDGE